jgi:putative intracellular protease/amidase
MWNCARSDMSERVFGATFTNGADTSPSHKGSDRNLVTGQNPASVRVVADLRLEALDARLKGIA